ncbi:hypothetical protein OXX79_008079 [Metschnikowia pulcherrima]
MSKEKNDLTVRQKFNLAVRKCRSIESLPDRQDSVHFQQQVHDTLIELNMLQSIVRSLSLFSANEALAEVSTAYLPFATLSYYEAILYQKSLTDAAERFTPGSIDRFLFKPINLEKAKTKILEFLTQIDSFNEILSPEQRGTLNFFKKSYNPSNEDILGANGDPTSKRASKIANFRFEKELKEKLAILDSFYATGSADRSEDGISEDIFQKMDEDDVRSLYVDQLRLFSVYAFRDLELIAMELQMLSNNKSQLQAQSKEDSRQNAKPQIDKFEYTAKLESDPTRHKAVSDLISKSGKILQPFVITSNKQQLRREVFGTGQVLPSMSIEEYLDYELANGKMATGGSNGALSDTDEQTDDSDEEVRKREWDDWKDENPKGSGNMKANIG